MTMLREGILFTAHLGHDPNLIADTRIAGMNPLVLILTVMVTDGLLQPGPVFLSLASTLRKLMMSYDYDDTLVGSVMAAGGDKSMPSGMSCQKWLAQWAIMIGELAVGMIQQVLGVDHSGTLLGKQQSLVLWSLFPAIVSMFRTLIRARGPDHALQIVQISDEVFGGDECEDQLLVISSGLILVQVNAVRLVVQQSTSEGSQTYLSQQQHALGLESLIRRTLSRRPIRRISSTPCSTTRAWSGTSRAFLPISPLSPLTAATSTLTSKLPPMPWLPTSTRPLRSIPHPRQLHWLQALTWLS